MPSTTNKPPFNGAVGGMDMALQSRPPIQFDGVTARFFPLKANMYRLRSFCDAYLNIAPEIVQFRPAFPYVFLMALDYGRMAATVGNLGWVSQHEIGFAVPLEWYRRENDQMVFVNWATVCPFIFVDNEMSLAAGRDVYGWPKSKVWLEREVNQWMSDPRCSANLLTMSSMVFRQLYAGKRQEPEVLLRIRKTPGPRLMQVPPDLNGPLNPFFLASRAFSTYVSLLGQYAELFTRLPLMGYGQMRTPSDWLGMLRQGVKALNFLSPPPPSNQITLKQFRDAEHPGAVCYQAIVNSEMRIRKYNGVGILGDLDVLAGDITGGFEIDIRRDFAHPVIESLGLDVVSEEVVDGVGVARLQPILPYWLDFDLEYGLGEAICWRTRTSSWQTKSSDKFAYGNKQMKHRFNTARGAGGQEVTGPFDFPNTTVRVLPLLADEARLQNLIDAYLNPPHEHPDLSKNPYRFEVWGSCVFTVVTSFGEMSSETNNVGWWADHELAFYVPVKIYNDNKELLSVAMVPVFAFADTEVAAITGREISGQPVITAAIKSPSNTWLTDSGPADSADRGLLTLETMLLPALHLGQEVVWGPLLDIHEMDALPYNDDVHWHMVADTWGETLLRNHRDKVAAKKDNPNEFAGLLALSLEVLANKEPINTITLKQFPDVGDPGAACYQAMVRGGRIIDRIYDIREIEERIHLRIRRYPNLPIAETLGLKVKWTDTQGNATVDIIQPIRPFWMRLSIRENLGENLRWRVGNEWLEDPDRKKSSLKFYFATSDPTNVSTGLVGAVGPQRLRERVRDEVQKLRAEDKADALLSREKARECVEKITPDAVIESILSKEWEHWGNPRWYRGVEQKPDFCIRTDSVGLDADRVFTAGRRTADGSWYSEESRD